MRRFMSMAAARHHFGWLLLILLADVAVGSVSRVASLGRVLGGGAEWTDLVGSAGLLLLLPAIVALTLQAVREVRRLAHRAEQDRGDLRALAASSHEWLWRADSDLRLTSVNRAVSTVVGYQPEQLLRRCLLDLVHPDATGAVVGFRGARRPCPAPAKRADAAAARRRSRKC